MKLCRIGMYRCLLSGTCVLWQRCRQANRLWAEDIMILDSSPVVKLLVSHLLL